MKDASIASDGQNGGGKKRGKIKKECRNECRGRQDDA